MIPSLYGRWVTVPVNTGSVTLTGVDFQDQVCDLWRHTKGKPKEPTLYALPQDQECEKGKLPLKAEIELAEGFAYIAAVKKGVELVSASALGLPKNSRDGLLVYVTSNDGVPPHIQDRLQSIASAMQQVATQEILRDECKDRILTLILQMNGNRIEKRLKASKHSRPVVLEEMQQILARVKSRPGDHSLLKTRLTDLCRHLRIHSAASGSSTSTQNQKILVLACYHFWVTPGIKSTRDMLLQAGIDADDVQGNSYLLQIAKIAAYEHISRMLVAYASDRKWVHLFRRTTIQCVPAHKAVEMTIPVTIAGGGNRCRIHAEVQLVIELEVANTTKWRKPRTIGSSKAACFLCDLFMQKHGAYFVPRSHGMLTPFWTIPNPPLFTEEQKHAFRGVVNAMSAELLKLIDAPQVYRYNAAMSWQALSQLNKLRYSRESLILATPMLSTSSLGVPSVLDRVIAVQPALLLPRTASNCELTTNNAPVKGSSTHNLGHIAETKAVTVQAFQMPEQLRSSERLTSQATVDTACADTVMLAQDLPWQRDTEPTIDFHDLNSQQGRPPADNIRDHESRICNLLSAHNAIESHQRPDSIVLYADNTGYKFDFHDYELFFEFVGTSAATIRMALNERPDLISSKVIPLSGLDYGDEITVDFGTNGAQDRTIFLQAETQTGTEAWLKLIWGKDGKERDDNLDLH